MACALCRDRNVLFIRRVLHYYHNGVKLSTGATYYTSSSHWQTCSRRGPFSQQEVCLPWCRAGTYMPTTAWQFDRLYSRPCLFEIGKIYSTTVGVCQQTNAELSIRQSDRSKTLTTFPCMCIYWARDEGLACPLCPPQVETVPSTHQTCPPNHHPLCAVFA